MLLIGLGHLAGLGRNGVPSKLRFKPMEAMMMRLALGAVTAIVSVVLLSGCESPGPTTHTFSRLRLESVDRTDAFEATQKAMGERFRIAVVDPVEGDIIAEPHEFEQVGVDKRLGSRLGAARQMRRVAFAHVSEAAGRIDVWCKVMVEKYDTAERQAFGQVHDISDSPGKTAIDRGSAATVEQNTVWTPSHRDKVAERAILQAVREYLEKQGSTPKKP